MTYHDAERRHCGGIECGCSLTSCSIANCPPVDLAAVAGTPDRLGGSDDGCGGGSSAWWGGGHGGKWQKAKAKAGIEGGSFPPSEAAGLVGS